MTLIRATREVGGIFSVELYEVSDSGGEKLVYQNTDLGLPDYIKSVYWRPFRNTIRVKSE